MANKTIALRLSELTGITGLKLRLLDAGTLINTGGTTLTESTNGWFSCVIAAAISGGWYDVDVVNSTGGLEASGGKVYIPSDTAGTYIVDNPTSLIAGIRADLERDGGLLEAASTGGIDTDALAQDIVDRLAEIEANPLAIVQSPSTSGPLWAYVATTWTIQLSNLPAASDWRRVWFSIKSRENQSDDAAIVRIQKSLQEEDQPSDGLQRIAGRAAAQGETGSLTVTQATPTFAVSITLSAAAAAALKSGEYLYDLKIRTTSGVELKVEPDAFEIRPSITRAIA